jgi:hypothetical protein
MVASATGPILPGEEGKIPIRVKTKSKGGETLKKTVIVTTDDPKNKEFTLIIKGRVDGIYTLTPGIVTLAGAGGKPITQTLSLVPDKEHRFSVKGIEAKSGENIKFQYKEIEDNENVRYEIVVENTSTAVGPYFDTLTVQTDSKSRHPQIKIQVFGNIR